jgi:hypothetical protein
MNMVYILNGYLFNTCWYIRSQLGLPFHSSIGFISLLDGILEMSVGGTNIKWGEIFRTCPDGTWDPQSLL